MAKGKNQDAWGRETARARYGAVKSDGSGGGSDAQAPQFPEDKHAAKYDNPTPPNWLRGMGAGGAEGKPGFDKSKGKR